MLPNFSYVRVKSLQEAIKLPLSEEHPLWRAALTSWDVCGTRFFLRIGS